jgi:hypothetical protein
VSSSRAGLVAGLYLKQQVRAYTDRLPRPLSLRFAVARSPCMPWLVAYFDHMMLLITALICRVPLAAGGGGRASRLFFLSRRPRCAVEVSTPIL